MRIAATAILLCLLLVSLVQAGQQITVLRGQDFPPYHYLDHGGRETGILVELIQKAASRLDLTVRFRQFPWSRCLRMLKDGKADAMMNLFKTKNREAFMVFSQTPLAREVNRFFTLNGKDLTFTGDMTRLTGLKIGAVRNYSYGKAFDEAASRLTLLRLETEKSMLMNLIQGRCDMIIGNEVVIRALADQAGVAQRVIPLGPKLTNDPLYIGFSRARGHRDLARKFSNALKAVKTSPEYRSRLHAYGL